MRGKVRRLNLGPAEKAQILRAAYLDYEVGKLLDKTKLAGLVECRARRFATDWLDGDFQTEFAAYIADREARIEAAKRNRLAIAGMLPIESTNGDTNAHTSETPAGLSSIPREHRSHERRDY